MAPRETELQLPANSSNHNPTYQNQIQMKQQPQPANALQMVMLAPVAKWTRGPKPFTRLSEKHDPSSRTIPDDSFTVADLFNRMARNQPLPLGLERPITYGEQVSHADPDISKLSHLDLTELQKLQQVNKQQQKSLEERRHALQAAEAAKRERDLNANAKTGPAANGSAETSPEGSNGGETAPTK